MKKKYPIYSDTHLNFTFPWTQYEFVSQIKEEKPSGLILIGDIACGITIEYFLIFLAKKLEYTPIYFVIGNHDAYSTSFKESNEAVKRVCQKYSNLNWLNDIESVDLGNHVGIIGEDGWYDGRLGNPAYLAYNLDWIMISEFKRLKTFEEKFAYGQRLADENTARLKIKLYKALEKFQTIYILTHVPPWAEATRAIGTEAEMFWMPYNVNYNMGKMIEDTMKERHGQNVIVLCGHTHIPAMVHVSHNIECIVQPGKYLGKPHEHNCLFI